MVSTPKKQVRPLSKKRKEPSPIKSGQDYSILLRKIEASASPALKKGRTTTDNAEEEDLEVILNTVTKNKNADMPNQHDNTKAAGGAADNAKPQNFTVDFFTKYMDNNVNCKMDLLNDKVGGLTDKVDEHGERLFALEQRIKQLEDASASCQPSTSGRNYIFLNHDTSKIIGTRVQTNLCNFLPNR